MLLPLMLLGVTATQAPPINPSVAARYFQEAKRIADRDGGRLWGKRLDGPMLFVDPGTRTMVANRKPPFGGFTARGGVWVGTLPAGTMIANTATRFQNETWSMVMWPLPKAAEDRANLMAHELFHRIQGEVGLSATMVGNAHLDAMDGRIWLQAEIEALRQALMASAPARRAPIEDALVFRAYRQSLFPTAKAGEDRMEVHEGMAEYTGVKMRGPTAPRLRTQLAKRMLAFGVKPSFPSSFAYETGPAYGLLLDELLPLRRGDRPWNQRLSPTASLTDRVGARIAFRMPPNLKAEAIARAKRYGYDAIFARETKREETRLATERAFRAAFVDGPVLVLPLTQMSLSFDPGRVFPLGDAGTVYQAASVGDAWGKITGQSILLSPDFKRATVPAPPEGDPTRAPGWTLDLRPGWRLVPGERRGDWTITKALP